MVTKPEGNDSVRLNFQPLFSQVYDVLFQKIVSGGWMPGDAVPGEAQLAREFGVSVSTMRKALALLEDRKLIVRTQGRGTFISKHSKEELRTRFLQIFDEAGHKVLPQSRVLLSETVTANEIQASYLKIEPGAPVRLYKRLRMANDLPMIYEEAYLSAALVPEIPSLEREEETDELYVSIQKLYQITVTRTTEEIRAVQASSTVAAHLKIPQGTSILEIRRVALDPLDRPVDFRLSYCVTEHVHYRSENE